MSEATLGLRDALDSAFESTPAEVEQEVVQEEQTAAERARDEKGRFASKQEEPAQVEPEVTPEAEPEPQVQAKPSPKAWKKELAEKYWNNIDPELQDEILRREEAVNQGFERYKTDAQYASEIKQVMDPFEGYMKELGVSAPVAIDNLLRTEYSLRKGTPYEKAQVFMQLANTYGVNLGELATQQPDPSFALQNEIAQLRGMYQNLIQSQQQTQEQQILSEIEQFAATHEHLDAVRDDMALLLNEGRAKDLDDAYNKAIRLHDDLFNQINAPKVDPREEANRAAKAAKQAAVSVKGSRSGAATATPAGSLREALEQSFNGRI